MSDCDVVVVGAGNAALAAAVSAREQGAAPRGDGRGIHRAAHAGQLRDGSPRAERSGGRGTSLRHGSASDDEEHWGQDSHRLGSYRSRRGAAT